MSCGKHDVNKLLSNNHKHENKNYLPGHTTNVQSKVVYTDATFAIHSLRASNGQKHTHTDVMLYVPGRVGLDAEAGVFSRVLSVQLA